VILNSMPDAVLVLTESAQISSANPSAEKLLGIGAEKMVNRDAREFLADRTALDRCFARGNDAARYPRSKCSG
jgi:PAS domain S-box-containing protein